jgi:hypothetical protein
MPKVRIARCRLRSAAIAGTFPTRGWVYTALTTAKVGDKEDVQVAVVLSVPIGQYYR